MISTNVEQIIVQLKEQPNGLWRNKALSLAHELFAVATMAELEIYPNDNSKGLAGPQNASKAPEPYIPIAVRKEKGCTCPAGSVAFSCPVHGGK